MLERTTEMISRTTFFSRLLTSSLPRTDDENRILVPLVLVGKKRQSSREIPNMPPSNPYTIALPQPARIMHGQLFDHFKCFEQAIDGGAFFSFFSSCWTGS